LEIIYPEINKRILKSIYGKFILLLFKFLIKKYTIMANSMNFLFNSTTKVGLTFYLELTNLSKKDSLNEYYENKIILQFYGPDFFFLIHKKKKFQGILLGFPLLDLLKIKPITLTSLTENINGIFIVFKNSEQFGKTSDSFLKFKENFKKVNNNMEIEKLFHYIIDRKKKKFLKH
jgi:hypothetical protein